MPTLPVVLLRILIEFKTRSSFRIVYCDLDVKSGIEKTTSDTGAEFVNVSIEEIDAAKRQLRLASGQHLDFEYLLLAPGSEPTSFGRLPADKCLRLNKADDAVRKATAQEVAAELNNDSVERVVIASLGGKS